MTDRAIVRMPNGDMIDMEVCGRAPKIGGDRVIITVDDQFQCYAARLSTSGWHVIPEPVRLYDV